MKIRHGLRSLLIALPLIWIGWSAACGTHDAAQPEASSSNLYAAQAKSTLNDPNVQQYLSAAASGNICQKEQQALEGAEQAVLQSGASQQAFAAFSSALSAFTQCVASQVPGLPPVPNHSDACVASVQNGAVVTRGDCSHCKVTQAGSSMSVSCDGAGGGSAATSGGGAGTSVTTTTTTGGGTSAGTVSTTGGGGTNVTTTTTTAGGGRTNVTTTTTGGGTSAGTVSATGSGGNVTTTTTTTGGGTVTTTGASGGNVTTTTTTTGGSSF